MIYLFYNTSAGETGTTVEAATTGEVVTTEQPVTSGQEATTAAATAADISTGAPEVTTPAEPATTAVALLPTPATTCKCYQFAAGRAGFGGRGWGSSKLRPFSSGTKDQIMGSFTENLLKQLICLKQ